MSFWYDICYMSFQIPPKARVCAVPMEQFRRASKKEVFIVDEESPEDLEEDENEPPGEVGVQPIEEVAESGRLRP